MISEVAMLKVEMRREVRAQVAALTLEERTRAALNVCGRVRLSELWKAAKSVLLFSPLKDEPDIWPLLEESLATGKTVALPRFSAERSGYVASQVRDLARDIRIGRFQIREPTEACPELALAKFDLILVPGVAFDHKGRRLGRGQGYYDRWLRDAQGAMLCGVAFAEQWLEEIPTEDHDITMHVVVTPTGVFRCGK